MDFADALMPMRAAQALERGYVFVPAAKFWSREMVDGERDRGDRGLDGSGARGSVRTERKSVALSLPAHPRSGDALASRAKGVGYWRASHLEYEYSGAERRFAPVPEAILAAPLFVELSGSGLTSCPRHFSRRLRWPWSRST